MTEDEAEEKAKENHLKLSYSYTASEEEKKGSWWSKKTEGGTVWISSPQSELS